VFINTNTENSISETDVPIFRYKHEKASLKMGSSESYSQLLSPVQTCFDAFSESIFGTEANIGNTLLS
jgi:hypothetical protein